MLSIEFGAATDCGVLRKVNEDSTFVGHGIAAVADGMGGHAAGDVASRIAVTRLEHLEDENAALSPDGLVTAILEANAEIVRNAATGSGRAGMGTTLSGVGVVAVAGSDHWMVFNVGDSRVYRLDEHSLTQVTVDHSEVEELVSLGELSAEQARVDPRRNVVTRSLGTDPAPQPDTWLFPPTPGDRFLVCSDGLTLELEDDRIEEILRSEPHAQGAADALVHAAVTAGGRDNVTAVVVDLVAPTAPTSDLEVDTAPRPNVDGGAG